MGPTTALARLSDAIIALVATAAPMLVAIRVGPNRHISGTVWQQNLVVTSDQALPAQDSYTLVLPGGVLTAARPERRNAASNLVSLRLTTAVDPVRILPPAEPRVGALALALGANADAAPMARMTLIHSISNAGADRTLTLDMTADLVAEGGPVLDATGGMLGMATIATNGEATVIPHATMLRAFDPVNVHIDARRGWLGVALQPITVPAPLRSSVGQESGRMVVSLAPSGPAELAGLRLGDVLLSLDGHSVSGTHALRTLLGTDRVGRQVEIRLIRDGRMETRHLIVAAQPDAPARRTPDLQRHAAGAKVASGSAPP